MAEDHFLEIMSALILLPTYIGIFWLNAAETWVDIKREDDNAGLLGSMFGSSQEKEDAVHAHFMSEAGIIDVFILLGPKPKHVSSQYASLTGNFGLIFVN